MICSISKLKIMRKKVMVTVNVLFVPKYSYMACAWGGVAGYGTAMVLTSPRRRRYTASLPIQRMSISALARFSPEGAVSRIARINAALKFSFMILFDRIFDLVYI